MPRLRKIMYNKRDIHKHLWLALFFCIAGPLWAQNTDALGTFTPYSMFGVGEVARQGSAFNRSMGGLGVALRDHRYVNYLNPASITARDTLAFMLDFGVEGQNLYLSDAHRSSAFNTFNMHHVVLSFPLYNKTAMILGIAPYSHTGYKFEEKERRPYYVSELGDVVYQRYGEGGITQAFFGVAVPLFKNLSVGAEAIYYFGRINRNSNVLFRSVPSFNNFNTGYDVVIGSFSGKFGLQYEGRIKNKYTLSIGATYLLPSDLKGNVTRFAITKGSAGVDTVYMESTPHVQMTIPGEYAVGFSLNKKNRADEVVNKWMVGFDYTRQDWSQSSFAAVPGVNFSPTVSSSFRVGFEFTPNFYDVRYVFKRWTYRGGVYHEKTYMKFNDKQIDASGITLGVSIPILHWSNLINFGVDFGQRGSIADQLVRERYVMFQLGISLYDIWFVKRKYE